MAEALRERITRRVLYSRAAAITGALLATACAGGESNSSPNSSRQVSTSTPLPTTPRLLPTTSESPIATNPPRIPEWTLPDGTRLAHPRFGSGFISMIYGANCYVGPLTRLAEDGTVHSSSKVTNDPRMCQPGSSVATGKYITIGLGANERSFTLPDFNEAADAETAAIAAKLLAIHGIVSTAELGDEQEVKTSTSATKLAQVGSPLGLQDLTYELNPFEGFIAGGYRAECELLAPSRVALLAGVEIRFAEGDQPMGAALVMSSPAEAGTGACVQGDFIAIEPKK